MTDSWKVRVLKWTFEIKRNQENSRCAQHNLLTSEFAGGSQKLWEEEEEEEKVYFILFKGIHID